MKGKFENNIFCFLAQETCSGSIHSSLPQVWKQTTPDWCTFICIPPIKQLFPSQLRPHEGVASFLLDIFVLLMVYSQRNSSGKKISFRRNFYFSGQTRCLATQVLAQRSNHVCLCYDWFPQGNGFFCHENTNYFSTFQLNLFIQTCAKIRTACIVGILGE